METERLVLRRLTTVAGQALHETTSDPLVMAHWWPGPDESVAETTARIEAINHHWDEHGFGDWAIVLKSNASLIGFAGLHFIPGMEELNVGHALRHDAWNQGFGSEACLSDSCGGVRLSDS